MARRWRFNLACGRDYGTTGVTRHMPIQPLTAQLPHGMHTRPYSTTMAPALWPINCFRSGSIRPVSTRILSEIVPTQPDPRLIQSNPIQSDPISDLIRSDPLLQRLRSSCSPSSRNAVSSWASCCEFPYDAVGPTRVRFAWHSSVERSFRDMR